MSAAIERERGGGGGGGERERVGGREGGIKIYSTKGRREGEEINERKQI